MGLVNFRSYVYSLTFLILLQCVLSSPSTIDDQKAKISPAREKHRILGVFGHPGKSHFDMFRPLLEELGRRGHELTVISFFPRDKTMKPPMPNYKDINLANASSDIFVNVVSLEEIQHSRLTMFIELFTLRSWGLESCMTTLYNPKVQEIIKSDAEFDLILTEGFNTDCFLGFAHRFKAPFITLSSHQIMAWVNQRLSNDDNPSYVPTIFNGYEPDMTFYQRILNTIALSFIKLFYEYAYIPPAQTIVEAVFGPGVPHLSEIVKNTSLVLSNTHFSLHGSKPNLPNIIEVGGIQIPADVEPLPADIQRFLDNAPEGVLYFSFGSMLKATTLPADKLAAFTNVIRSIPRKVIWKWEEENFPNKPSNLMIKKWLPQAAILRHPNVKCYMAHGGLLGLSEGVYAGVPMIVIPMFGDQFHNAAAARARGVAEVLTWADVNEATLRSALDRVFNDSSYLANARALSMAYRDRPMSPVDTAVWWTEYIARGNGIPYLKSSAQNLTWYQYYLLDVFLVVGLIVLSTLYATYRLGKCVREVCFPQEKAAVSSKKSPRKKIAKKE